ncbi:hypothetical protein [Hymenobacter sp. CRA2]|uniref:hypothetical protein n=1 Tax=Hymenobacter sp. CRA2 TaxID=1955620 RepID=UPI001117909B|nr:hypothetical protein [Hymenobacter sp. CRA2]
MHGLHYLGDKLRVIEMASASLTAHGVFVANLDLANILIGQADARRVLGRLLRANGLQSILVRRPSPRTTRCSNARCRR